MYTYTIYLGEWRWTCKDYLDRFTLSILEAIIPNLMGSSRYRNRSNFNEFEFHDMSSDQSPGAWSYHRGLRCTFTTCRTYQRRRSIPQVLGNLASSVGRGRRRFISCNCESLVLPGKSVTKIATGSAQKPSCICPVNCLGADSEAPCSKVLLHGGGRRKTRRPNTNSKFWTPHLRAGDWEQRESVPFGSRPSRLKYSIASVDWQQAVSSPIQLVLKRLSWQGAVSSRSFLWCLWFQICFTGQGFDKGALVKRLLIVRKVVHQNPFYLL